MPAIQIMYPGPQNTSMNTIVLTQGGLFIASGRARDCIIRMSGRCTFVSSTDGSVGSSPTSSAAHLYLDPSTGKFKRWMLAFKLPASPASGQFFNYSLDINSTTSAGAKNPRAKFNTSLPFRIGNPLRGITISWPTTGTDISSYVDDFVPYGDLDTYPLDTVFLTDNTTSTSSTINPSYEYDSLDMGYWCAQFPTLTGLLYDLTAVDTSGPPGASANNLTA